MMQLKNLEKTRKQTKPKSSQRQVIKTRVEINEIDKMKIV